MPIELQYNTKAGYWLNEIEKHQRAFDGWRKRCKTIEERYLDERQLEKTERKFAMLWANTETLKPAVYSQMPEPAIVRRHKDRDPVARISAEVLERAVSYTFDKCSYDRVMMHVRDNFLLYARAQVWFRYVADIKQVTSEETASERLEDEKLAIDFLHRNDFLHGWARDWLEVPWVAKRVFMDKKALKKRFGADIAAKVQVAKEQDYADSTRDSDDEEVPTKAEVFEIWDKQSRKVYWVTKHYRELLDESEPLLDLEGFFPCPEPCYGTIGTEDLKPVPDYIFYQDQAEEVDVLTRRIAKLSESLKIVGFYPDDGSDGANAIERAAKPKTENAMIPIPNWAMFAEKGGSGAIQWWPVDVIVQVLDGCIQTRKQLIEDIYQITGVADIMRGASDAQETLGAQQLKAQWGSTRIRDRQWTIQRFARDCTRIAAEIMAERFQPKTLQNMTGMMLEPLPVPPVPPLLPLANLPPEMVEQHQQAVAEAEKVKKQNEQKAAIIKLLRTERRRGYRIDIETDSTIEPDEIAAKQAATEFLTAVSGFVQNALPVAQAEPSLVPMLGEMLKSYARKFRAGRELEEVIERAIDELSQAAKQPQEPPPDPAVMQAQARAQIDQAKLQMDGQKMQADQMAAQQNAAMQVEQEERKREHEFAMKQLELDHQMQIEREKLAVEAQLEEIRIKADSAMKLIEVEQSAQAQATADGEKQAQNSDASAQMATVMEELAGVIAQLSAPKQITVNRDGNGQIIGAEQQPVLN